MKVFHQKRDTTEVISNGEESFEAPLGKVLGHCPGKENATVVRGGGCILLRDLVVRALCGKEDPVAKMRTSCTQMAHAQCSLVRPQVTVSFLASELQAVTEVPLLILPSKSAVKDPRELSPPGQCPPDIVLGWSLGLPC